jgi:phosphatidate cytidylyltransferase
MSKIIQRLLIFFIGIPAVLALVFVDTAHHLPLQIAIILTTFAASHEMYHLLAKKSPMQNLLLVMALAVSLPVMALVCSFIGKPGEFVTYMLTVDVLLAFFVEVFFTKPLSPEGNFFEASNKRLAATLFVLVYAGFLITFLSRIIQWDNSVQYLAVFFVMVFFCDSFAWFLGMAFGKGNREICKVSPNKSIAGFIGGFAGPQIAGFAGRYLWPQSFPGSPAKIVLLGFFVAVAAIIGDLAESLFKRSAEVKDAGSLIPGRGGMLDSIDSILMAAPIYYLSVKVLFNM